MYTVAMDIIQILRYMFAVFLKILAIYLSKRFITAIELSESACIRSLITLKDVQICPSTKEEYESDAKRKNCSKYTDINCKSFQYHCTLNENMTGLVEVCTTSRLILSGRCAEFNTGLKTVRDSYSTDCTQFQPPCPNYYNSTEAYKYPDCYKMVPTVNRESTTTCKYNEMNDTEDVSKSPVLAIVIPMGGIMLVILIILTILWYRRKLKRDVTQEATTSAMKNMLEE